MKKFITYDGLPIKAGGAHRLNKYTSKQAYDAIKEFIELFTTNNAPFCTIALNSSHKKGNSKASFWSLVKMFGLPQWSLTNYLNEKESVWTWIVWNKHITKAIELNDLFDNLTLSILWHFKFVDPETREILAGQVDIPVVDERLHNSQVYLGYGEQQTVSFWFAFPFYELDSTAVDYIKLLRAKLPVAISNNHWRLWTLSDNNKLTSRKLDVTLTEV
jgi:hypothetical protein